jgi:transposase
VTECLSVSEVARRLGTTRDCAEAMLIRAGIPLRRRRRSELSDPGELRRLYEEEGLTTRALADRYGVHQATLWRALQDAGAKAPRRGSWAKPKWPERIGREVLEQLYVGEELSIREVARRLGVWETTVRKVVGYGIPIESHHPSCRRPSRQELVDLYVHQGLSTAELATRFGVHRRTPWHWLSDAGIARRPSRGGQAPLASSPRRRRGK